MTPQKHRCYLHNNLSDEEFQVGLDDYYEARGWTTDGIPTVEKLNELNLGEYAYIIKGGKS